MISTTLARAALVAALLLPSVASAIGIVTTPGDDVHKGGTLVKVKADLPSGSCQWIMITDGISYEVVDTTVYIAAPCRDVKIRLICFGVDWETKKFVDQQELMIAVDGDCDDDDDVDPDPDDPDPPPAPDRPKDPEFEGLSGRVWDAARKISDSQRKAIVALMTETVENMVDAKWVRIDQARDYVRRNWPPCDDDACAALLKLIATDGANRRLDWQEATKYYQLILNGVK